MGRKSRNQRLLEIKDLAGKYEDELLTSDYRYKFMKDISMKLERGRSLSPKQRAWIDSLIEEGVPEIERDSDLIEKIKNAISTPGMEHRGRVLSDFLGKVAVGSKLTQKQDYFLQGMLKEAEKAIVYGPYSPSKEDIAILQQCVLISNAYTGTYWETHPGTYRALNNVKEWLESPDDKRIDEWSVKKIKKALSSRLREINESPYVSAGSMVWVRSPLSQDLQVGVVTGNQHINERGHIVYDILCCGEILSLPKERIAKRNSKKYGG